MARKNQLFNEEVPIIGLENLEFGPEPLAKGCSAVVYPARWKNGNLISYAIMHLVTF